MKEETLGLTMLGGYTTIICVANESRTNLSL